MSFFSRIVSALFLLILMMLAILLAVAPFATLANFQDILILAVSSLQEWQDFNPTNFIIGQATLGIASVLIFGLMFWLTAFSGLRRGAIIHTLDGGSAELDTNSISRRLEWHLEQIAEISNIVPLVRARGSAVDIRLELEVASGVDIPMKTDEVVIMTRDVIEDSIGLKLGKLDVHLRCAPIESVFA